VFVALVAVVIVATLTSVLIQRGFDNLSDRQAQAEANDTAERLGEYYDRRGNWRGIEALLRRSTLLQQRTSAQRRRIQLLDESGSILFDSASPLGVRKASQIANAMRAPVEVNGRVVGAVLVSAAGDDLSQAERDFLARVRLSVLIGSVTAGAVALIAGLVSASRVTSPLRSLTVAARRLASGVRHDPLPLPADRELAELATAFNTMASELQHQEDLRRQQVADIAHELRTPLSVMRLQLESIEDGIEQPTPDLLGSLTEEVGLLGRLVDDLRLISLADAGQLSLNIATIDVGDCLRQAATSASARARQQGLTLQTELPEAPLQIRADPQRVAQVLGNLLENAIRYTPSGGVVTLSATRQLPPAPAALIATRPTRRFPASNRQPSQPIGASARVVMIVRDTGPGIPPEDVARLFERFWRADRARARETGGSGLGLAIVKRLTELQGGQVWATSELGHGTSFHVAFPISIWP
jgi:signal transduction histidine kinase